MHFILPNGGPYGSYVNEAKRGIQKALKNYGYASAILSTIYTRKENCITKEKFDEMYKTTESEGRMDLSVGEDLETFIERIKNGLIKKDWIPEDGEKRGTFLICLLDEAERKKLEQKDKDFMRTFWLNSFGGADVSEAEWKASEYNLKFARSECERWTYFIDA